MYTVRYTENARQDLEDIFTHIAEGNLENALSFLAELQMHLEKTLSVFPHGGTFHNKDLGIRKHSYKGYTAFYQVSMDEAVYVLHVIHLGKPLLSRGIEW